MFNPEQLLGHLLKSGLGGGLGRGGKRKRGGSFLGGMSTGAKAQIGMGLLGVAVAAYEHYTRQNSASVTPSPGPPPTPTPQDLSPMPRLLRPAEVSSSSALADRARHTDAMLLVQAMVAAAAADGIIDEEERAQMLHRAEDAGFDEETKRFLQAEIENPKSLAVIVASARPELATDLYAASCAAITADTDAERTYLKTLSDRLKLSEETRAEVHRQLDIV